MKLGSVAQQDTLEKNHNRDVDEKDNDSGNGSGNGGDDGTR